MFLYRDMDGPRSQNKIVILSKAKNLQFARAATKPVFRISLLRCGIDQVAFGERALPKAPS
jgi:hypothetical protein